jgi:hypothetical protein
MLEPNTENQDAYVDLQFKLWIQLAKETSLMSSSYE